MNRALSILFFLISLVLFISCENESDEADEANGLTSRYSGIESHNAGKNCLSCHKFITAGTVYNKALNSTYPGTTVKITSQANGAGSLLATVEVDQKGNFYTGKPMNFGSGVYVSVTGTSGTVKYMGSAITSGACNSCHGSATLKIWAE